MSREIRFERQANHEPSLGMSIGLLCLVLFAIFAIVSSVSVPDVQFVQTDFLADLQNFVATMNTPETAIGSNQSGQRCERDRGQGSNRLSAIDRPPGAVRGHATGPCLLGAFPQMHVAIDDLQVWYAPEAKQ